MSKQKRNIIIAAIAVLLLAAGLFAAIKLMPKTKEAPPTPTVTETKLFLGNEADVTEVGITNKKGSYTLKKVDSKVIINGETALPMNSLSLGNAYSSAVGVATTTQVKEGLENLADYGLATPTKVTVKTKSGAKTLNIGAASPMGDGYYCYIEGENRILLTNSQVNYAVDFGFNDYISTDIMPKIEAEASDKISEIILSGSERADTLTIVATAETTDTSAKALSRYAMTSPIKATVNTDTLQSLIKQPIMSFSPTVAVQPHPTAEQLIKFGLDKPALALSFTYGGAKYAVKIGGTNPDGFRYMMKDGVDIVYLVDAETAAFIKTPYQKIKSSIMYIEYIDKMASVEYARGSEKYTFKLSGEGDAMVVNIGDKTIKTDDFKKLYQSTIGLQLSGEAESPKSEDYATVTYTKRDGTKDVETFRNMDGRRLFVAVNDSGHSFILKSELDAVFETAKKLSV